MCLFFEELIVSRNSNLDSSRRRQWCLLCCCPQVSYSSTCSALKSKFQFPTFLRTVPSDQHQSAAIAKLVIRFGWTWVGTISADDDYGKYGIKAFKEQVEEAGVCISFSETLPKVIR